MKDKIFIQGYGSSGGTLVGDFFYEFDNMNYLYRREFDLFRGSGGIYELGNLIEESCTYTKDSMIRRFYKLIDFLEKWGFVDFYGQDFRKLSMEFANNLIFTKMDTDVRHYSINETIKPPRNLIRPLYKLAIKFLRDVNYDKNSYILNNLTKDEYILLAKKYMQDIFNLLPSDKHTVLHHPFIIDLKLDKQIPYFDGNYKVFIVDKDPRDIYTVMYELAFSIPCYTYALDIDKWIKIYKQDRRYEEHNMDLLKNKVMKVRCEDFINNYDSYSKKIINFVGLKEENHVNKFKYFNPEISKQYVGKYKTFKNQKIITKIEKELAEYIYEREI